MLTTEIYATSHIGRVRRGNEDNFLVLQPSSATSLISDQEPDDFVVHSKRFEIDGDGIIVAVSDGMGGALAGEVASRMAVETVRDRLIGGDPDATISPETANGSLIEKLYDATVYANNLIHYESRTNSSYSGMGATFTGGIVTPEGVDLIQVGDSRAYLIRNARIYQVTKDQSLVQQLIDSNQISPAEAEKHAMKNVILQALGAQNEVYPVPARLMPRRGDVMLFCSDGLSNKLGAEDLLRIILENIENLDYACNRLVTEANDRGGEDNITLVLLKLMGSALQEPLDEEVIIEPIDFGDIHDTADQNL